MKNTPPFLFISIVFIAVFLSNCGTRDLYSDSKEFLVNYYQTLERKEVHKFDDYYEPVLSIWFDQDNIKLDDVKSKSRAYFKKWPISKHVIDFTSLNCNLNENGTLNVSYNLDYYCSKQDAEDSLKFNIDIELLLTKKMKIISIQDDVITRTKKEYFSEDWSKLKTSKNASYYRILTLDKEDNPEGLVKDYYITGELQWSGGIKELSPLHDTLNVFSDTVIFYYKNGQKLSQAYYEDGVKSGLAYGWEESGLLNYKHLYFNGELSSVSNYEYYVNSKIKNVQVLDFENSPYLSYIRCDELNACERHISDFFVSDISLLDWSSKNWNISKEMMFNDEESSINNYTSIPYSGGDFRYSVYMTNVGSTNTSFGIIYGYYDNDNFNKFLIKGKEYLVYSIEKGIKKRYNSWTASDNINKTVWNLLMIQRVDDKFSYYINGFLVFEQEAFGLRANNFGFTVTNPSESSLHAFDDFEFIEPISKFKIDEL